MLDFVNYFNDKNKIDQMRQLKANGNVNVIKSNLVNDNADETKDQGAIVTQQQEEHEEQQQPTVLQTKFNVMEHSDPGLFALSFMSTNLGLEMFDRVTKKWIKIKPNEGIWWNGKMSETVGKDNGVDIKSGLHRIMIDEEKYTPRFTGWYEISCNFQLKQKVLKQCYEMKMMLDAANAL